MARKRTVSGLPAGSVPEPKNRWSQDIDRSPRVTTALAGFGAYVLGALLLIVSVWVLVGGLLLVTGTVGSGWQGRLVGVGLTVGGVALFTAGRWLTAQYAVQRQQGG